VSSQVVRAIRLLGTLVFVVLALWGACAWWALSRVQSTGDLLRTSLQEDWLAGSGPRLGTREKFAATADELAEGRFWAVGSALAPVAAPTTEQRAGAAKFLAGQPQLRERLLAITEAAQQAAADGEDVTAVRDALARAYQGAVKADEAAVFRQLDLADRGLDLVGSDLGMVGGPVDEQAVARLVAAVEPAYRLSQDLMTEGGAAAEKVLINAARSCTDGRYGDAATAIRLAGELLGAEAAPQDGAEMPEWFAQLGTREVPPVEEAQATAAVELAEAITLSMTPGKTVTALVKKARRALNGGDVDSAAMWAGVTLNALGMSDAAIAAATSKNVETPADEAEVEDAK
jgi:hypothetical protein